MDTSTAVIDPKHLSDKGSNDRKVLRAGLRQCVKIVNTPALQKFLEPVPTDDEVSSYWWPYSSTNANTITDDELDRFVDEKAFTLYHPVGTARIGPSPSTSVVDLRCRVHGVNGLRVADASVFPEQISGHPMAPVGAVASKISAMIKEDHA
jgi:choline dehydrogenase